MEHLLHRLYGVDAPAGGSPGTCHSRYILFIYWI